MAGLLACWSGKQNVENANWCDKSTDDHELRSECYSHRKSITIEALPQMNIARQLPTQCCVADKRDWWLIQI